MSARVQLGKPRKLKKAILFLIATLLISGIYLGLAHRSKDKGDIPENYESLLLVALGDTGTGSLAQMDVASSITDTCRKRPCDAVILLGDVIYDQGVESPTDTKFTNLFEIPYQDINAPFYITIGNHDYLGCKECYISYSSLSKKWKFPNYYYRKSFSDLLDLFVIDSENFNQEQIAWIDNEIKKSSSTWKIVAGHHPIYTNSKAYIDKYPDKKSLLQEAICGKFDLYLAGHSHDLEHLGLICGVEHVVSGGGGAEVYEILPNNSPFSSESHGYVLIEVDKDSLILDFYNEKGTKLYSFTKEK